MRIKKLIKNSILISILLIGGCCYTFYFGGFYMSEEESIHEYLEIMDLENSRCLGRLQEQVNLSYALYENVEKQTFSILKTTRHILGYKTLPEYSGIYDEKDALTVNGEWRKETGMRIILRKNNLDIAYVVLKMNHNTDEYVFSNWLNEYSWKTLEYDDWRKGTYYSYDIDGNLMDVTEF